MDIPLQKSAPNGTRRAFSLLELMIVIIILGLLTAISLPIMSNLEAEGRAVQELSGARSTVAAWREYAVDRDGELLKGYYPDSQPSEEPLYDFDGNLIAAGPSQQRWLWRLAPYLENPKETLYPKALEEVRREFIDVPDHQYVATIHPAFGLNSEWVGGLGEDLSNALYAIYEYSELSSCPWMRRLSDVRHTSKLMVFASSRFGNTESGAPGGVMPGIVEGFHRIESPFHPSNGNRWGTDSEGNTLATMTNDPADHGFVSARHNGKVVTAMVDGSTSLEPLGKLSDMRRWADLAWKRDWQLVE
ncbi:MAG: type II secretion system protein [Phycisphaerales bacterium]|nr:type II secretion system protein [Phycisphaerales bacterium]